MHLLLSVLFLRQIYTVRTVQETVWNSLYAVTVFGLFLYIAVVSQPALGYVVGFIVVYLIVRLIVKNIVVRRRLGLATSGLAGLTPPGSMNTSTFRLYTDLNTINCNADNIDFLVAGDDWAIYNVTFEFYNESGSDHYMSKRVMYTVYEHILTRQLPRIVFDNKRAHGRQFRYRYVGSQRLSLEGNFDKTFDTYTPENYHIDTLSFITPEVMLAMLDAKLYDIEISADRLFMYAPLSDKAGVEQLARVGNRLGNEINDNIDNYRDSFLLGPERKTTTMNFGRQLLISPMAHIASLVFTVMVMGLLVTYGVHKEGNSYFFSPMAMSTLVFVAIPLVQTINIIRDNRQKRQSFRAAVRYIAENPDRRR